MATYGWLPKTVVSRDITTVFSKLTVRNKACERTITSDDFGHVWILFTDTISQWDEATGRFRDTTVKLPLVQHFKSLRWGHLGFWGWNEKGLHCFIKGQWTDVPLPSWLPASSIWEVAVDQKRTLWLETLNGQHINITGGKAVIQKAGATVDYVDREGHVGEPRIDRCAVDGLPSKPGIDADNPIAVLQKEAEHAV